MLRASGHQLPLLTAEAEAGSREWEDFSFVVAADTQLGPPTAQNNVLVFTHTRVSAFLYLAERTRNFRPGHQ